MKKIIKVLEKQEQALRALVQKRQDHTYDKSNRWLESDVGEAYEDKTMEIDNQADELFTVIDGLKELI